MTPIGPFDQSTMSTNLNNGMNQSISSEFDLFPQFYQVDNLQQIDEHVALEHVWEELNRRPNISQAIGLQNFYESSSAQLQKVAEVWNATFHVGQFSCENKSALMYNAPSIQNEEEELANLLQSYYYDAQDQNNDSIIESTVDYGLTLESPFVNDLPVSVQQPSSDGKNAVQQTQETPFAVPQSFPDVQKVEKKESDPEGCAADLEKPHAKNAKFMREDLKPKNKTNPEDHEAILAKRRAKRAEQKESDPKGYAAYLEKERERRSKKKQTNPEGHAAYLEKARNRVAKRKEADPIAFNAKHAKTMSEYQKRKKEADPIAFNARNAKRMREARKGKKENDPIEYAAHLEKERARKARKKEI